MEITKKQNAVTVVLPVFNGFPYLPMAVESVLNQRYTGFDFLIIDDGSTDESAEYLRQQNDSRVRVVSGIKNIGLGGCLNKALDIVNTPYIARMDADDMMESDRLLEQMRFLREHPDMVVVGCQLNFLAENSIFPAPSLPLTHEGIFRALRHGSFALSHPAIVFSTGIARGFGGYRVSGPGQDLDFFMRLTAAGVAANLPNRLHIMRIREDSYSIRNSGLRKIAYDYAFLCDKRRSLGRDEPSYSAFLEKERRKRFRVFRDTCFSGFSHCYRKGILARGRGHRHLMGCWFIVAATFRPIYTLKKALLLIRRLVVELRGKLTRNLH